MKRKGLDTMNLKRNVREAQVEDRIWGNFASGKPRIRTTNVVPQQFHEGKREA
jgi:hypothetical protein